MTDDPRPASPAPRTARTHRTSKRHIVLIALVPVLVAVWIPVLGGGNRNPKALPAPAAPPAAAPAGEVAPPTTAASPVDAAQLILDVRRRMAPYEPLWSAAAGDPFVAGDAGERPAEARPEAPAPTADAPRDVRLVPTTVLLSRGELPIAIIAGRQYRLGDEIDGNRITAIEEQRVVYRRGDEVFAVTIRQPTLPRKEAR